jgi:hypothetical protein
MIVVSVQGVPQGDVRYEIYDKYKNVRKLQAVVKNAEGRGGGGGTKCNGPVYARH